MINTLCMYIKSLNILIFQKRFVRVFAKFLLFLTVVSYKQASYLVMKSPKIFSIQIMGINKTCRIYLLFQ